MPPWHHLPTNTFIGVFNDDNRPWRHPLNKELIHNIVLPPNIELPDPLMPTNNHGALGIYHEAMIALAENDITPDGEKEYAEIRYIADRRCWERRMNCQNNGWLKHWPWNDCENDEEVKALYNWKSQNSADLDELTISLLKRSYRYALLNLSHTLLPFVTNVRSYPHQA